MIWSFCLTLFMLTSLYRQMFLFLLMHKILFSSFSNCAGERDQVYTNFLSSCSSSAAIKITQKGTYNRYSEIQFQFSFYDAHVIYNRKKCIQWIFILNVWVCLLKLIFFFFCACKVFWCLLFFSGWPDQPALPGQTEGLCALFGVWLWELEDWHILGHPSGHQALRGQPGFW